MTRRYSILQLHPEAFGVVYVVEETNRGWLATVFSDRIGRAAPRLGVGADTLLGLVIAHEVGHLLLGVGYHGETGVMRAQWPAQLLGGARGQWRFSRREAAAMRQAACPRVLYDPVNSFQPSFIFVRSPRLLLYDRS